MLYLYRIQGDKMKKYYAIVFSFFVITLSFIFILNMNKSYSYGLTYEITGTKGNRKLTFYDEDTNKVISVDTAINSYGISAYLALYDDGDVYFYRGSETNKDTYVKGSASEYADKLATSYGASGYRVKTTQEFKNAIDDVYKNYKIGEYYFFFSEYDSINFDTVKEYYMTNYGLSSTKQDYYTYTIKGPQEPARFAPDFATAKTQGYLRLDTYDIRISKNELQVVEDFVAKILPLMNTGSDYTKILAAYTYIINTTSYLVDDGFVNDLLASNTSIYDVFINRKSVCIGYSIAFSYLMDKMGIESYIVDDITSVDDTNQTASSSHTFNIVKLDGKFYRIDLTGKQFLTSMRSLYDNKLTLATSAYNTSGKATTYTFDYTTINTYLNASKTIKTTTTKRQELSIATTKAQAPLNAKIQSSGVQATTYQTTTTTDVYYTPNTETVTQNGGTTTYYINPGVTENVSPTNSNGETIDTNSESTSTTSATNTSKGINMNYIFVAMIIFVIIIFILYKLKFKKNNNTYDSDISDIIGKYRK